jgi:hypothetical protein
MQALGSARATQDLDLVTEVDAREGVVGFMESLGYETLYQSRPRPRTWLFRSGRPARAIR